jgi:hypothetical protein
LRDRGDRLRGPGSERLAEDRGDRLRGPGSRRLAGDRGNRLRGPGSRRLPAGGDRRIKEDRCINGILYTRSAAVIALLFRYVKLPVTET